MAINPDKVHEFVNKAVGDLGAAIGAALVVIGDKLGLYKGLKEGPATSEELAKRTGTAERYVREWLAAQAAAGYVSYDAKAGRYFLTEEQAECLTNEESPACVVGGFQAMVAAMRTAPKVMEAFRSGKGVGWHEHEPDLFRGTERFFRPGYNANLVSSLDPRARRRARTARGGRCRRRRRLRPRRVDDHPRQGVSEIEVPRLRLPSAVGRGGDAAGARSRPGGPGDVRRRLRQGLSGDATIWSPSSIAFTTWATPSAPPRTCVNPSAPMARGCSSSPTPAIGSRTI